MTGDYICQECSGTEWEFIISNVVHDDPHGSLFQCKKCKRVVQWYETFMSSYTDKGVRL